MDVALYGANEHFAEAFDVWDLGQLRLDQVRDLGQHFAGQHKFGKEIHAILVVSADDVHGFPGGIQNFRGIRTTLHHLPGQREGLLLPHVGDGLD